MSKGFKITCLLISTFCSTIAMGQSGTVSPYSRFGVGDLIESSTVAEFGMGGLTLPHIDSTRLHFASGASLGNLNRTVFQFGVFGEIVSLNTTNAREYTNTSNLQYLGMGFPIAKWWKTAVSMRPYSSVGYELDDRGAIDSVGVDYSYKGSGGLNTIHWSNAFNLIDGLSLGVSASYLYGSMNRTARVHFDSTNYHHTYRRFRTNIADFNLQGSISYQHRLSASNRMAVSANYIMGADLKATRDELIYTYTDFSGVETVKDTLRNNVADGVVSLPKAFGIGVSFHHADQWMLGTEIKMQDWSTYRNFGAADSLGNSFRFAMGGAFTPNSRAINSYLSTVTYRAGFHYGQHYQNLRNEPMTDFGIGFGLGLPLRTSRNNVSEVNLGFEFGKRGTTDKSLIQENYFRFKVGIALNDKWFIKRKID